MCGTDQWGRGRGGRVGMTCGLSYVRRTVGVDFMPCYSLRLNGIMGRQHDTLPDIEKEKRRKREQRNEVAQTEEGGHHNTPHRRFLSGCSRQ
jgi:hypothetical protein